jgi:hypothetical protein
MSESMFTHCIDELRYKSKIFKETGFVTVYDVGIVKSDSAIPRSLNEAFREAVAPLEDIPVKHRDWHPGSNETVLDLVHPSLFPVVYGQTKILKNGIVGLDDCVKRCGEGETSCVPGLPIAKRSDYDYVLNPYSVKFQWLPSEIKFDGHMTK